ncbi:hypothetical protein GCM10009795_040140 [Nocardioides hankookensis]|uniref:DNA-binding protein n=1 Tax=Nocardioides hankookensis TaxID=443157 RepID=A0ABW1LP62_9ACTN
MTGPHIVDAQAAAELFNIPAAQVHKWKHRKQLTEVDSIPGRSRNKRVPLFDVDEIRPLVAQYKARVAARADTPEAPS